MTESSQRRRQQSARAIAELIEQLSRSVSTDSFSSQMNHAQWTALRYLAQANESARQIGAFATFHMTTPSSASQTISSLVDKGMVVKRTAADARRRTLNLTAKGRRMLERDPILGLVERILNLSDASLFELAEILQLLVQTPGRKR